MCVYDGIDKKTALDIINSLVNTEGITLSREFLKSLNGAEISALNNDEQNDCIKWHPYPKEKPTKDGTYIVTIKYEDDEESCVITSDFFGTYNSFCGGRFITAWAYPPNPYEDKKE